jgi:hypothetical protein
MLIKRCFLAVCFYLSAAGLLHAQPSAAGKAKPAGKSFSVFKVNHPDYKVSPYTGMTRQHWKEAGLYLLKGAFSYIHTLDDPMKFPKQEGKSYPRNEGQIPTEKLEGLCRTLFIAAPLLKENPSLQINGIKVGDYYRHQISRLIDSTTPPYIRPRAKNGGPSQILVEFGGLSVSLFAIPEIIWDPLSQAQKDKLAATMLSYGDGPTIGNNWKFFNVFILSFYKSRGYKANDSLLNDYLQKILAHYRGDGWYNDSPAYDYYSMWAFQMYGTLWSEFFGKQYYPQYAAQFAANFSQVKDNYPYMFGRSGEMIMWGRSISYRMGAVIPLPLMGLHPDASVNFGWMRRISSGALLQFLQDPDFLQDNIPTLGFYGAFEPAVQSYSCRGSVFWMGKAFLGLLVPASSPFWTAKENEGPWQKEMVKGHVYSRLQDTANILITDYPGIGAAEIRAWCHAAVTGASEPWRGGENYNRLSYNSAFPWQADGPDGEVAMNYVFKNGKGEWEPLRLFTFVGYDKTTYYRDAVLETNKHIQLHLADMLLPNGILRIDENMGTDGMPVRLGHYALPAVKGAVKETRRKVRGYDVQLIDNGVYQLAMVPLSGWKGMEVVRTKGLNPVSAESAVINVTGNFEPLGSQPQVYATLMLWKRSGENWTDEELAPVKKIEADGKDGNRVSVSFYNGDKRTVLFGNEPIN